MQPNAMVNTNMQMPGAMPVNNVNPAPMGIPMPNNGQNLTVNVDSPLGFMNNGTPQNVPQTNVNPMGNQFLM